jgi:GxxExxY protein
MKHGWTMLEIDPPEERPFLYKETTEKIIGAAFEVHRELGYGFLERVYQRALQVELLRKGVSAEIERRIQVHYKGVVVGDYDADLIVDGVVAVELKVNPQYDKRDEAQLLNELKATGLKVGLLINFGRTKVEYKRLLLVCVSSVSICGRSLLR